MIATVNQVIDHKLFLDERDALVFLSSYRQHLEHEKHHFSPRKYTQVVRIYTNGRSRGTVIK